MVCEPSAAQLVTLTVRTYDGDIDYEIRTTFNRAFPAVVVRYRPGRPRTRDDCFVYTEHGSSTPGCDSILQEVDFCRQMAAAWSLAAEIMQHHATKCHIFSHYAAS